MRALLFDFSSSVGFSVVTGVGRADCDRGATVNPLGSRVNGAEVSRGDMLRTWRKRLLFIKMKLKRFVL
jgi:hypothetical protein